MHSKAVLWVGLSPSTRVLWLCPPAPWCTGPSRICISMALVMSGACTARSPEAARTKGIQRLGNNKDQGKREGKFLKSNTFRVLSHRFTNTGGVAEAYFHPEAPPHVPDLLGCVCCWDNIPFPHHPQIAGGTAVEKKKKKAVALLCLQEKCQEVSDGGWDERRKLNSKENILA